MNVKPRLFATAAALVQSMDSKGGAPVNTVMITGASGFIGADLLRELREDYRIAAIGRTFKARQDHTHIRYVQGDLLTLTDAELLAGLPEGAAELCIHAAGQAHIAQSGNAAELFQKNNVDATEAALRLAAKAGVRKFILISSAVVYNGDETDLYERSKRSAEARVRDFCQRRGIAFVIVRPVMVYGEDEPGGYCRAVVRQLRRGYYLLPNSGKKPRPLVYVRNVSYMIREAMTASDYDNDILLARDNEILTLRDFCQCVLRQTGMSARLIPVPAWLVKTAIVGVNLVQLTGLLKRIKVRSLRNLNVTPHYPLSEANARLVQRLPFTAEKGITRTIASMENASQVNASPDR